MANNERPSSGTNDERSPRKPSGLSGPALTAARVGAGLASLAAIGVGHAWSKRHPERRGPDMTLSNIGDASLSEPSHSESRHPREAGIDWAEVVRREKREADALRDRIKGAESEGEGMDAGLPPVH